MTIFWKILHISSIYIPCEDLWWIDYLSLAGIHNAHTVVTLYLLLFTRKWQLEYHGTTNKRFAYPFQALCSRLSTVRGHWLSEPYTLLLHSRMSRDSRPFLWQLCENLLCSALTLSLTAVTDFSTSTFPLDLFFVCVIFLFSFSYIFTSFWAFRISSHINDKFEGIHTYIHINVCVIFDTAIIFSKRTSQLLFIFYASVRQIVVGSFKCVYILFAFFSDRPLSFVYWNLCSVCIFLDLICITLLDLHSTPIHLSYLRPDMWLVRLPKCTVVSLYTFSFIFSKEVT